MPTYNYEIGTTSSTTNVESLTTPVNPPRGDFREWSRSYDKADGTVGGDGFPMATWTFDLLSQAMVAQLRTFCTGRSASVFINTRKNDDTFAKYSGVMIWDPGQVRKRAPGDRYRNIVIEFRKLQAV